MGELKTESIEPVAEEPVAEETVVEETVVEETVAEETVAEETTTETIELLNVIAEETVKQRVIETWTFGLNITILAVFVATFISMQIKDYFK